MNSNNEASQKILKALREAESATTTWLIENLPAQKVNEFLPLLSQHLRAMNEFSQDCVMAELRKKFNV